MSEPDRADCRRAPNAMISGDGQQGPGTEQSAIPAGCGHLAPPRARWASTTLSMTESRRAPVTFTYRNICPGFVLGAYYGCRKLSGT
jgi:hypothetical protein